jgi:uncharacterized protein (DUF1330 family)
MIGACEDLWEEIAVVEYPSSEVFARIVNAPEYDAIARHRVAGLAGQLNIETTARVEG